ncbi:hypothetical protein PHYPSEUDO_008810 [Phytophthora pseudosyringae]|uniref:PH domain-containing protein n=1 Tax=Phytophthora pseudosyringae TaxID=221518 RepID=A0A8T1W9A3_9STRA|nr:hypothetical protein PHYPSEUDO_008810 [Phytophthora pseudosyringae]
MASSPQTPVAGGRLASSSSSSSRPAGQSTALISAYLLKQSAGKWKRKRWNQRWFVLDRDTGVLRYFRHASRLETVPLRQDAHGVLSLKQAGVSLVVQGDLPPGVPTPFCFTVLVDGQRELRLCADANAEFRQWTTAISAVISPSRAGARAAEARVTPTRVPSPTSSAVEVPSPLQSPVAETKGGIGGGGEEAEVERGREEMETRQVVQQMCSLVSSNKTVLLALNPAIVLVRFGDVSVWVLAALLANALCVWLLWFRVCEPRVKPASTRPATCPSATMAAVSLSPTSSAGSASGSEISREKSSSTLRTGSATSRDRASSSSVDEPSLRQTAFLGQVDGVNTSLLPGASLKMCAPAPMEIVPGCWAQVDATRFNVRQGPNYRKTKLKAASAPALLELVAVDVYQVRVFSRVVASHLFPDNSRVICQSDVKADNVGSIVDLSGLKPATGNLDLFIVNCQVPSYQPSNPLWGEKQGDGPGFNFVTYFAIPPAIREMLDAPADPPLQAVRLLKDFMQSQSWVSERFKAIGIVVNPQEQTLGRAERHLLETYNGQPILTRPQHRFHRGDGYFEVDVNAHDFNYIARKGLVGVSTHACNMILDFGFVLEGQEDHELPEQILGCVRLCNVDVRQAPRLS